MAGWQRGADTVWYRQAAVSGSLGSDELGGNVGSEGSSPVQHVREGQSQYTNIEVLDLGLAWVCSEKGDVSSTDLLLLRNVIVWWLPEISLKLPEAS